MTSDERVKTIEEQTPWIKEIAKKINRPASMDVEDLVSAGVMGLCVSIDKYDGCSASLKTFSAKSVIGEMIDAARLWRSGTRANPYPDVVSLDYMDYDEPGESLSDVDNRIDIESFIGKLEDDEIAYIRLRYYDGLTNPQIAAELGVSRRYTRSLRHRAIMHLKFLFVHAGITKASQLF